MAYFRTGGGTDTSDANAVAGDILLNKTAYVNDEKLTGTMPNNGAISGTIEAGETFTVPAGYTSGGTITASSAGATITVTYDSSFYNKTMTCTNGTKTYTKTTTSSGSTTFNVNEEGTWTITCNDVSRTVNVVLSYTTQMAITKTVTVYGAVGATISFTDTTGSKTVTLDSSGQGSVDITFIPPSATITFTDTNVAKNPNNLSQNYSKTITMTDSITSIYVMPDNALYWWGYKANNNIINTAQSTDTPTYNTNSISFSRSNNSWLKSLSFNKLSGTFTSQTLIGLSNMESREGSYKISLPSYTVDGALIVCSANTIFKHTVNNVSTSDIWTYTVSITLNLKIYALYYE